MVGAFSFAGAPLVAPLIRQSAVHRLLPASRKATDAAPVISALPGGVVGWGGPYIGILAPADAATIAELRSQLAELLDAFQGTEAASMELMQLRPKLAKLERDGSTRRRSGEAQRDWPTSSYWLRCWFDCSVGQRCMGYPRAGDRRESGKRKRSRDAPPLSVRALKLYPQAVSRLRFDSRNRVARYRVAPFFFSEDTGV